MFWRKPKPEPVRVEPPPVQMTINQVRALDNLPAPASLDDLTIGKRYQVYQPVPGVLPEGEAPLAADEALGSLYQYAAMAASVEGLAFPGFPLLSELAQRAEYRKISETIAREMTRKWIEIKSTGEEDKSDKIRKITKYLDDIKAQDAFRRMAEMDGLFGRGHLYMDFGDELVERKLPLVISDKVITPDKPLLGLRPIEPIWTYPNDYNAFDPADEWFYKPRSWFVNGVQYHESRLLTFISREMPDILKPAYGFAGLSMSQMAVPYVTNWLRTRQSVSDLIHSFSVFVLKTNMAAILQGGGNESLLARADLFNRIRDNRGMMLINNGDPDNGGEELTNVSANLSSLDKLQAQSQEQMAAVAGIPLVKLLGVTPAGLNASSDGEIRVFYDTIHAEQEQLFRTHLHKVIDAVQLSIDGVIDPEITFDFLSGWELDEVQAATVRKTNAETDILYSDSGILAPEEVRKKVAADPASDFNNIDVEDLPEQPENEEVTARVEV